MNQLHPNMYRYFTTSQPYNQLHLIQPECKIWTTYIQTCRDISLQASHTISFTLYSQCVKYEPPTSKHVDIFHYKPAMQSASHYTVTVQNMNHNFIQTYRDISLQASHAISYTLYSQCVKYEPPSSKHVEIFHYKPAMQSALHYTVTVQNMNHNFIQTCWDISIQASHAISFTLYSQCVKYEPPSS